MKRNICDQSIKKFKQKLRDVKWDDINHCSDFNQKLRDVTWDTGRKIRTASITFESFLNKIDATMPADPVIINAKAQTKA